MADLSPAPLDAPARPFVWSIAASDSGGGAGIQADSLTISDLGGHACNVLTAVTAQNSTEVIGVEAISNTVLLQQLNCLLIDMPPKAIKIGVLATSQQVILITHWLTNELANYEQKQKRTVPVIWDPVMLASTGQPLTENSDAPTQQDYFKLAKKVTLLTPNLKELEALASNTHLLSGSNESKDKLKAFAQHIQTNVLLTGGDVACDQAQDWLAAQAIEHTPQQHQEQLIVFFNDKVKTRHNHGTGCTFSSAIATAMALGYPLLDAIVVAKAYVAQGLTHGYKTGQGPGVLARLGWPVDLQHFPKIKLPHYNALDSYTNLSYAKVTTPLKVYPVTESLSVLEQTLKGGAMTVQLRIKQTSNQEQLEKDIQQAIHLGEQYGAQVFINDHWQLAIKYKAFGVHLGQEDMLVADMQKISQSGLALGLSSHGYFEMLIAYSLNPGYLAVGHIFPTPTKSMPSQPQGLHKLTRFCQLLNGKIPLVAIGGINSNNLKKVHATQVDDIAVVRAIEQAENPASSWQELQSQWLALA
jgi:hydroxymethylpyrimidine kinase/phosphomethylpyrimidine kinase/thiamine-phosphate diphosphorylase